MLDDFEREWIRYWEMKEEVKDIQDGKGPAI